MTNYEIEQHMLEDLEKRRIDANEHLKSQHRLLIAITIFTVLFAIFSAIMILIAINS